MFLSLNFLPEKASTFADKVDSLYLYLVGVSVFFAALIFALVAFFAIRYRRKSEDEIPEQIHGSTILEITWSVIPFFIVMSFFVFGAIIFFQMNRPPDNALEVFVVGKQWMWKLQHPEGNREINELHIPINRPVKLTMTSEDVIHSFYVPAFRIKMDVVPGKYTTTWFEATQPGKYHLFCTEYCGTKHSQMTGWVYAMEPDDYESWLQERVSDVVPAATRGEDLFQKMRCITCHNAKSGALGPNLEDVYGSKVKLSSGKEITADEDYFRESILEPNKKVVSGYGPIMPSFKNQLKEEEVLEIIQYIKSLKTEASEETTEAAA